MQGERVIQCGQLWCSEGPRQEVPQIGYTDNVLREAKRRSVGVRAVPRVLILRAHAGRGGLFTCRRCRWLLSKRTGYEHTSGVIPSSPSNQRDIGEIYNQPRCPRVFYGGKSSTGRYRRKYGGAARQTRGQKRWSRPRPTAVACFAATAPASGGRRRRCRARQASRRALLRAGAIELLRQVGR